MHTCAAVATAPGKAGISVIRLSGEDAFEITNKVFKCASGKKVTDAPPNTAIYGDIIGLDGKKIDSGLCTCFFAPRSYTGENVSEISCHGSPVGTSLVLAAIIGAGAKPALAGEFTKRAFINGKLDLTQAEAVGQLIDAESAASLKVSSNQLSGVLSEKIKQSTEEITNLLASLYAYIDYPDEDMTDIPEDELKIRIQAITHNIDSLCSTYSTGIAVTQGIDAAIVGKPNTGKSSFLNMMLGFERAIVTDVAGTTRDVVSEKVSVGNILLRLSDTAGLRETPDEVEKIGVERSYGELEKASVVFAVFDVSGEVSECYELCGRLKEVRDTKEIIIVLNKCDKADAALFEEYFVSQGFGTIARISAKNCEGKEKIVSAVEKIFPDSTQLENASLVTNARQYASLKNALVSLNNSLVALETLTPDTTCLDLENALSHLLEADGRKVSEQIVNAIFSHFCVGK